MSDSSVRRIGLVQSVAKADEPTSTPALPAAPRDLRDATSASPYVVFTPRPIGLAKPRAGGVSLDGRTPNGQSWHTEMLTPSEVAELRRQHVHVSADAPMTVAPPAQSVDPTPTAALTGLDFHEFTELARRGPAWQGEGTLFIDIDTGVGEHPDIDAPTKYFDVFDPDAPPRDVDGHGTFTYGEVKGHGDPATGGVRGSAPLAEGAVIRVINDQGRGSVSSALKGVQKAVEWGKDFPGFVTVNMSLSGRADQPFENDELAQAVEDATKKYGIYFAIAAGNTGPREGSIGTPGIAPSAVTVGALDHRGTMDTSDDGVPRFSSRDQPTGPKPTLTADGARVRGIAPGGGYTWLNGTSMASPYGAGAGNAIGGGLYAQWKDGRLNVNPRELVKTGEFQRTLAETSAPIGVPVLPHNVGGAGDLRVVAAADGLLRAHAGAPGSTGGPAPTPDAHTPSK